MTELFEVTEKHIQALDGAQLPRVLRRLYYLQVGRLGIAAEPEVNLQVRAADRGEDGFLKWVGGPDPDGLRLRERITCFQSKATSMPKSACASEVVDADNKIKSRVREALVAGGEYVIYCGKQTVGDEGRAEREAAVLAAIQGAADAPPSIRPDQIRFVDAAKIADWCNEFSASQAAVFSIQDRPSQAGVFETVESWREGEDVGLPFFADQERTEAIRLVRELADAVRGVGRLLGLPGLGKTRIVLEAVSGRPDDELSVAREQSCVYVADGDVHGEAVLRVMRGWVASDISGTVIVDECSDELHRRLARCAMRQNSKLSLITLDHDPQSMPESISPIVLDELADEEMRKILEGAQNRPPDDMIRPILTFAGGYPQMLSLVLEAGGVRSLWNLAGSNRVKRMLEGREGATAEEKHVIVALSLFDPLGIAGDARDQLEWFCQHLCGSTPVSAVERIIKRFRRRRIVDQRSDYVRVTPPPLAAALAASWWDECSDDAAEQLLTSREPYGLQDAVFRRLRLLRGHEEAVKFVDRFLGDESPFASSERLLSATGARVLRELADINRRVVLEAVTRALGGLGISELRSLEDPRRDLVECLDKLCWHGDTFASAYWLLLRLAAAENETWSNNATGVVARLMQLYLSGTTVPAVQRFPPIDRALASEDADLIGVAVTALDSALRADYFARSHSGELPDGRLPHKDWQPREEGDVADYWEGATERLIRLGARSDDLGQRTQKCFSHHVRGLVGQGLFYLVRSFVEQTSIDSAPVLAALRDVISFDADRVSNEDLQAVKDLIARMEPQTLEARLRYLSTEFGANEFAKAGESWRSVSEDRAQALGRDLGSQPNQLERLWAELLSGEQPLGVAIGVGIADGHPSPSQAMAEAYDQLMRLPGDRQNAAVLRGIMWKTAEQDPDSVAALLDRCASDGTSFSRLLDLTLASPKRRDADLVRLMSVLRDETDDQGIHGSTLGLAFKGASDDAVAATLRELAAQEPGRGALAIEAAGMYLHRGEMSEPIGDALANVLQADGVFGACARLPGYVDHTYKDLLRRWAETFSVSDEFIRRVVAGVLDPLEDVSISAADAAGEILVSMLMIEPAAAWGVVAETLVDEEVAMSRWSLCSLLRGGHFGRTRRSVQAPMEVVPRELILGWVAGEPSRPRVLARICRPLQSGGESAWSDLARWLLDNHGDDEAVRTALGSNASVRSWTGSRVPVLEREREVFRELTSHSNPAVAAWAKDVVGDLGRSIATAKREDEAEDFGVFR